jgi:hypothetical protein
VPKFFGQNNCGGNNRSGERAAPRFIDTGDSNDSGSAQFLFVPKSATPIGHRRENTENLKN